MISSNGTSPPSTDESNHEPGEGDHPVESALSRHDRESRAIDFIRALESLDDREILARLRSMVVKERRSTTTLLAHLAVLDGRRLYIAQGYSSLFNYCTRGLHFSEQAAYLRIQAARVVRRFPAVLARVADGSIHLTALSLLRPHLTTDNHRQLFDAACHRSRREIEDLVAVFRCGPTDPPRARFDVVPPPGNRGNLVKGGNLAHGGNLAQAGAGHVPPTAATLPFNRMDDGPGLNGSDPDTTLTRPNWWPPEEIGDGDAAVGGRDSNRGGSGIDSAAGGGAVGGAAGGANSIGNSTTPGGENLSYRLHLTISSDMRLKLEQARELLRHQVPDGDPAKILDRALGVLLDRLEQRKFARLMARPTPDIGVRSGSVPSPDPIQPFSAAGMRLSAPGMADPAPARNTRDLSAATRREVWYRDGGRCAFVGDDGVRCDSRGTLEYHHLVPWANGGASNPDNLALRCRVHNAWESEVSFARSLAIQGNHEDVATGVAGAVNRKVSRHDDRTVTTAAEPPPNEPGPGRVDTAIASSPPAEPGPDRVEGLIGELEDHLPSG